MHKIDKPYTEQERINFIFKYNQDCFQEGYNCRIKETETALYALEPNELLEDDEVIINPEWDKIQFSEKKNERMQENDNKAEEYRYSQEFTVTIQGKECLFDTKEKTQNDLNTATNFCLATGGTYDNWVTNNGIKLNLTLEDISIIGVEFKAKADIYSLWAEYKEAIEQAETLEQLEAIEIRYDRHDET